MLNASTQNIHIVRKLNLAFFFILSFSILLSISQKATTRWSLEEDVWIQPLFVSLPVMSDFGWLDF